MGGSVTNTYKNTDKTHTHRREDRHVSCTQNKNTKTAVCTGTHDHSNTGHTEVINVMAEK